MIFNNDAYPYASSRVATFARNGMVATSQPLAASVGLDILKKGGNAVDAAIATAAALTVVEPSGFGFDGDAFAQVWMDGKLHGLNASSVAPGALTPEAVAQRGFSDNIPLQRLAAGDCAWNPLSAWEALSERFGKLPFAEVCSRPSIWLSKAFRSLRLSAYFENERCKTLGRTCKIPR
ncbi:MAG: gamma-glutamyltranspeptidase/glutathione hydrolase [Cellvibrionaceae bacterium]|jgi:gamma-glutamyltranspeptidase/glutathione hydrolase